MRARIYKIYNKGKNKSLCCFPLLLRVSLYVITIEFDRTSRHKLASRDNNHIKIGRRCEIFLSAVNFNSRIIRLF